jgi:MinD-like ATPase involved in chromosome partitioning or flagellar assembly
MAGLIISVITNKGGTGKTTTVVSLGQALVREEKKGSGLRAWINSKRNQRGF